MATDSNPSALPDDTGPTRLGAWVETLRQPVSAATMIRLGWLVIISLVVLIGFAGRISVSRVLGVPFWFPDSISYVRPALESPLLPFSQFRTIGFPALLSIAINLGGHPQVVLVVHHLLWAASTIALVSATWIRLRAPACALAIAWWLSFCQKTIAFELGIVSEHATRCLITTVVAMVVLWWGRPTTRRAMAVGLLVGAAVLVRPTAVALLPVVAVWLLCTPRTRVRPPDRWQPRAIALCIAVILTITPAVVAFWSRYGFPALSSWGSVALYAHVVHLTDLDDPSLPDLTAELRPIVEPLAELSDEGRRYVGDWAVFGTVPEWAPDDRTVDRSTWAVIEEHVRRTPSDELEWRRISRTYGRLARRAIATHPGAYAAHVARSFVRMWREGMTARYPHPDVTVQRHALSVAEWSSAYREAGRPPPEPRGVYRRGFELSSALFAAGTVFRVASTHTTSLVHRFGVLAWAPVVMWCLAILSPAARRAVRGSAVVVGVGAGVTVSWMGLHALVLVSESLRLMVPVHDAVALIPIAATQGLVVAAAVVCRGR